MELADINAYAGENKIKLTIGLVFRGLVDPKLSVDQSGAMKIDVLQEIGLELADFSGMAPEKVAEIKNLSDGTTTTGESGK